MNRREVAALCVLILATGRTLEALPPLGLTRVGDAAGGNLQIIDGSAYIGTPDGVHVVDSSGDTEVIVLRHDDFGLPNSLTRVVQATDGRLFVAANFPWPNPSGNPDAAAVFALDEPTSPVVTWRSNLNTPGLIVLSGVDITLRGIGTRFPAPGGEGKSVPVEFLPDGSVLPLEVPNDPLFGGVVDAYVADVADSGYAVGGANQPGTLGFGGAIWSPKGEFSFYGSLGNSSIRDRSDGEGFNVGFESEGGLKYGDESTGILLVGWKNGSIVAISDGPAIVSQTDFAVVNSPLRGTYAYYPGILLEEPDGAVPIEDVFPELATINFDGVSDLYAVDGYIYMTLVGEDGLYLFGARDPSVIPEPATVVLAVLLAGGVLACRRNLFRCNGDASAVR